MIYPKERRAIYHKLGIIGRAMLLFNRFDCYDYFGYGKHFSSDWQKCINSMVKRGKLVAHPEGKYSLKEDNHV